MATIGLESIKWAALDVSYGSLVLCYNPSVTQWFKSNLNHVHISSWKPFPCKSIFKNEFYPMFITFGIILLLCDNPFLILFIFFNFFYVLHQANWLPLPIKCESLISLTRILVYIGPLRPGT
jgi:hypothetical protein